MISKLGFAGICVASSLLASAVGAQTFSVELGPKTLGLLQYRATGSSASLLSQLNNTPLGVFNGTFEGTSQKGPTGRKFTGISKSSRKSRTIVTLIKGGKAIENSVTPAKENTDLSETSTVPTDVTDPVVAVGMLINAKAGCPGTIQIYDGRRAISLTPTGSMKTDGVLVCDVAYRVFAGPGHLSPLKIAKARMQLTYATGPGGQVLDQIRLKSGIFALVLNRQ